jgi:hypothetical protein
MRHSDSLLITKLYCVQHAAAAPLLSPPWPVLLLNVRSAGHMAEWTGTSAGGGEAENRCIVQPGAPCRCGNALECSCDQSKVVYF